MTGKGVFLTCATFISIFPGLACLLYGVPKIAGLVSRAAMALKEFFSIVRQMEKNLLLSTLGLSLVYPLACQFRQASNNREKISRHAFFPDYFHHIAVERYSYRRVLWIYRISEGCL
ncbi:hypothetical protein DFS33DRAFT_7851 [Desarmillaria ectypa]|nr:hypothetical protein DFS33DRAFT_7851 [Desarmillaria ectypa]